jgi:hypothetical protein
MSREFMLNRDGKPAALWPYLPMKSLLLARQ